MAGAARSDGEPAAACPEGCGRAVCTAPFPGGEPLPPQPRGTDPGRARKLPLTDAPGRHPQAAGPRLRGRGRVHAAEQLRERGRGPVARPPGAGRCGAGSVLAPLGTKPETGAPPPAFPLLTAPTAATPVGVQREPAQWAGAWGAAQKDEAPARGGGGLEGASERGLGRTVVSGEKAGLREPVCRWGTPGRASEEHGPAMTSGLGGVQGQALCVGDAATALLTV